MPTYIKTIYKRRNNYNVYFTFVQQLIGCIPDCAEAVQWYYQISLVTGLLRCRDQLKPRCILLLPHTIPISQYPIPVLTHLIAVFAVGYTLCFHERLESRLCLGVQIVDSRRTILTIKQQIYYEKTSILSLKERSGLRYIENNIPHYLSILLGQRLFDVLSVAEVEVLVDQNNVH